MGLKKFTKPRPPDMDDGVQIRQLASRLRDRIRPCLKGWGQEKLPMSLRHRMAIWLLLSSRVFVQRTRCSNGGLYFQEACQKRTTCNLEAEIDGRTPYCLVRKRAV